MIPGTHCNLMATPSAEDVHAALLAVYNDKAMSSTVVPGRRQTFGNPPSQVQGLQTDLGCQPLLATRPEVAVCEPDRPAVPGMPGRGLPTSQWAAPRLLSAGTGRQTQD